MARRTGWLLLVSAAVALLVACGEDDETVDEADDEGDELEIDAEPDEDGEDELDMDDEPDDEDEAEEPEEETYEVQSGDTLSAIANEFDVEADAIVEANDIDDPDLLVEGTELVIPAPDPDDDAEPDDDGDDGDDGDEGDEGEGDGDGG
ncbi:LysM peptidoglycan-binding domain-containing protein [Egibacter rhizosphaerae]|nr:LysM domain-containing protein [Egibacter rhizosphaerae]